MDLYTCSVCGKPASIDEGIITRTCEHSDAAVTANLVATVYGESSVNQEELESVKS